MRFGTKSKQDKRAFCSWRSFGAVRKTFTALKALRPLSLMLYYIYIYIITDLLTRPSRALSCPCGSAASGCKPVFKLGSLISRSVPSGVTQFEGSDLSKHNCFKIVFFIALRIPLASLCHSHSPAYVRFPPSCVVPGGFAGL